MMKLPAFICVLFLVACSHKMTSLKTPEKDVLKVMSYNIHHCNPPSAGDAIDVDTIAGVIRKYNPDLVALQEVDVNTKRSGSIDQARLLGEKTGMQYYFFKAINHDGGEYGLAILSKEPVIASQQYALPTIPSTKGEPRILSTIKIKTREGKELIFACTHLDAQRSDTNRLLQIEEIEAKLKDVELPVIIAGDLNAATGSSVINQFDQQFKRTCDKCAFTIPVVKPNKTIDFIGYSPAAKFEVRKHEVINERYASDHLPVYVEIKLN